MKKLKITSAALMIMLGASVMFAGCQKNIDNTPLTQEEVADLVTSTEADAEADVLYDDVFNNVMGIDGDLGLGAGIGVFGKVASTGGGLIGEGESVDSVGGPRCFTITITPQNTTVFPKTVTLDFGNGCLGKDGRTRRGKIITEYTGKMAVPGSKATTSFDNYYVDSVKVEGVHSIQNNSTSNNRIFNVIVTNGKLSKPSGNYTAWNKNKIWFQTEGNGTPNFPLDDEFSITGSANGTVKKGTKTLQWSHNILQAVIRRFVCPWAVKGQVSITRNARAFVLDYGNGVCDNKATITINGNTYNITLR